MPNPGKLDNRKTLLFVWDAAHQNPLDLVAMTNIPHTIDYQVVKKLKNREGFEQSQDQIETRFFNERPVPNNSVCPQ